MRYEVIDTRTGWVKGHYKSLTWAMKRWMRLVKYIGPTMVIYDRVRGQVIVEST